MHFNKYYFIVVRLLKAIFPRSLNQIQIQFLNVDLILCCKHD